MTMRPPTSSRHLPSAARRFLRGGSERLLLLMDAWEESPRTDPLIEKLRAGVRALPLGGLRDALHGRWLGHPVHPLMVQVPIGTWMSAGVLDAGRRNPRAARTLVGTGLLAAAPAALAGWTDWADLRQRQLRVGLGHAVANSVAVGLYTASFAARRKGNEGLGRALGFGGLAAVSVGGALGGHLAYRQASGANHAEEVPDLVGDGWHSLGAVTRFPVGEPVSATIRDVPVVAVREAGGTVHVLADRCSHMAGPLSAGTVADGCVRCPWHGSAFRLSDGWNVRGPATAPQPAFTTRIVDGQVEARVLHRGAAPEALASGEEAGR